MQRCGSCRQHGSAYAAVVPRAAKAVIQATANAHLIPHLPCPCHVLKNVSDPVQAFQEIGLADYHTSDLQGPSSEAEKNSLTWYISTKNKTIGVSFQTFDEDGKSLYDNLLNKKDEIEAELGFELNWDRIDGKIATRISHFKHADLNNKQDWDSHFRWILEHLEKLNGAFRNRIKKASDPSG